ncbi:MAG: C10 family peptidase [Prevotella sp.]|nr:C10 family peptidase [Prevotella sp.]
MRKLLLFITLFVCHLVLADSVTPEEALQKAQTFLSQKSPSKARRAIKRAPALTALQQDQFYIFNIADNGGFVVVSGDDRTEQILGYSDSGNIDEQNMPENMRSFLQEYADGIKYLKEHNVQVADTPTDGRRAAPAMARKSISPLLSSSWNQNYPYNAQCPVFTIGENSYPSVTGCVATAMAQVMYYHRCPINTTAQIPAYTSSRTVNGQTFERTLPAIPAGTAIDWNNMKDYYYNSESDNTSINAISTLMLMCGQSVEMSYSPSASGASSSNVVPALVNYFDYEEETVRLLSRYNYGYTDWQEIIYKELQENRPVYYSGSTTTSGHAFVCDGYDQDDFYHINWGWGGTSDGYFRLYLLNPHDQGIGGSTDLSGYGIGQEIIVGIKPNDGISTPRQQCLVANYIYERDHEDGIARDAGGNFKMNILYSASNPLGTSCRFDAGLRILNSVGTVVKDIPDPLVQNLVIPVGWTSTDDEAVAVTIDGSVPDGDYKMIMTSRMTGSGEMLADVNSENVFLSFTISGNTLTVNTKKPVFDLQLNSISLSDGSDGRAGSEQAIVVNLTNNGSDYHHELCYLLAGETRLSYAAFADVKGGKTADVAFTYTPASAGDHRFYIYAYNNGKWVALGSQVITFTEASASTADPELTFNPVIANKVGENSNVVSILGNKIKVSINITNPSATDTYNNYIQWDVYEYQNTENFRLYELKQYQIKPGQTQTIEVIIPQLRNNWYYGFSIYYRKGSKWQDRSFFTFIRTSPALTTWTADGTESVTAFTDGNVLTIPAGAAAVDISGLAPSSVVRNGNPNCLIYTDNSSMMTDMKNVVLNGNCENLQLTDGYDFYIPQDIQAVNCQYARTLAGNCNERKGWETIMLPFDVQNVSIGGSSNWWKTGDADTGAQLFVREFTSEQDDVLNLDYATDMKAGQPYFIGGAPSLAGQQIILSGSNQYIEAGNGKRISGGQYKNVGSYRQQYIENVYVLNSDGNAFTGSDGNVVQPFRAYFLNIDAEASAEGKTLYLNKEGEDPTAIRAIHVETDTENVRYNLSGQRVDSGYKGVVIKNGKKLLVR